MWLYRGYMTGDGRTDIALASLPSYRPGENRVCLPAGRRVVFAVLGESEGAGSAMHSPEWLSRGTCDDCGFAPFGDDTSTTREIAFAKIRARVAGTRLAAAELGL